MTPVIIPTYNDDKFLPRAVNSIVNTQDYTPIEVVIVDSGDSNIACQLAQRHANLGQVHALPEVPGPQGTCASPNPTASISRFLMWTTSG
jgi:cellulose synthase/poly-beta-1,6-N-acetylglucosamine synthase-like glycosyltransferase